ncbi:hypothetical protein KEM52_000050, partial [Ascosphaera acerosa]
QMQRDEKLQAKRARRMMRRGHGILKRAIADEECPDHGPTAIESLEDSATVIEPSEDGKAPLTLQEQRKQAVEQRKLATWQALVNDVAQRNEDDRRYQRMKQKAEEEGGELDYTEIIQASLEPAMAHLERLRGLHQPGSALHEGQWQSLRTVLMDGFTISQLEEYIERYQAPSGTSATATDDHSVWQPAMTALLERGTLRRSRQLPSGTVDAATLKRYLQGKSGLAERILRVIWRLERPKDLGRMEMRLDELDLEVLMTSEAGGLNTLKRIADSYEVKLDVQGKSNTIRITGTRTSCNAAHDAIHESVADIQRLDFDPRQLLRLSEMTSTREESDQLVDSFVDLLQQRHHVLVTSSGKSAQPAYSLLTAQKQDYSDAARSIQLTQLLQARSQLASPTVYTTYVDDAAVIPMTPVQVDGLDWISRHSGGQFRRWVSPLAQEAVPGGRSARRPPAAALGKGPRGPLDNLSRLLSTPFPVELNGVLDQPNVSDVLEARVGNVLFHDRLRQLKAKKKRQPASASDDTAEPACTFSRLSASHLERASFHTSMLPEAEALLHDQCSEADSNSALHVKLRPSAQDSQAPVIDLELGLGRDSRGKALFIRRAIATLHQRSHCLLLPHTNTDLRFTQSLQYDLLVGGTEAIGDELKDLVELMQCHLTPQSQGSMLAAVPTTATLQLPAPVQTALALPQGPVQYLLPSSRQLRSLRLQRLRYRDQELLYQHLAGDEGGILPPSEQSIVLRMGLLSASTHGEQAAGEEIDSPASGRESEPVPITAFYAAALRLAFEIGALAVPGIRGSHARPQHRTQW